MAIQKMALPLTPVLALIDMPIIFGLISLYILCVLLFVAPFWIIARKAGFQGTWAIVAAIPGLNYIFLWIFALSVWPPLPASENERIG